MKIKRIIITATFFAVVNFPLLSQEKTKIVTGKITYENNVLPNVNILIKGSNIGTKTDAKGTYSIATKTGDILQFSYVGLTTVSIMIEDVTRILNVKMFTKINMLEETVVVAKKNIGIGQKRFAKKQAKFETSKGVFDPVKAGYPIKYIDKEEIGVGYISLTEFLQNKYGYQAIGGALYIKPASSINTNPPAIWDVDGMIFKKEPPIDISTVESVRILRTLAGTVTYGFLGAGGVIVVKTFPSSFSKKLKEKQLLEKHGNKNYYNNDALSISSSNLFTNKYINVLKKIIDSNKAYNYYLSNIQKQEKDFSKHLDIALLFADFYKDKNIAKAIFNFCIESFSTNPEILKAIAYHQQKLKLNKEALNTYKKIFNLRKNYAQSYRDLANSFHENEYFVKSWRIYLMYLSKINKGSITGNAIGNIIFSEMEWLYFNRKNHCAIKRKFVPREETIKDFRKDIRILVEWNVTDADFEMEFVNPQQQSYVFKHTLFDNENLLIEEKKVGFSSKDFIIPEINEGNWLLNLTYFGNKRETSTYFKVTIFYNWSKPNQKQEVKLYKFTSSSDKKYQLILLNKDKL